jgi:metal-responsive CopG/Arc/MetJ family transcriptional regulator
LNTQKVAITVPADLLTIIDDFSKQKGMSRSRYISSILREKVLHEKEKRIKAAYNRVFSDELILKEQIETASWLEGTGSKKGQEW